MRPIPLAVGCGFLFFAFYPPFSAATLVVALILIIFGIFSKPKEKK